MHQKHALAECRDHFFSRGQLAGFEFDSALTLNSMLKVFVHFMHRSVHKKEYFDLVIREAIGNSDLQEAFGWVASGMF